SGYNPKRGDKVIAFGRGLLDEAAPQAEGSWREATGFSVADGKLAVDLGDKTTGLADAGLLAGYKGEATSPSALLLSHNGLHIEIVIDRKHPIGKQDAAGIADVVMEAAMTTIIDLEDSIAAVDAEDK